MVVSINYDDDDTTKSGICGCCAAGGGDSAPPAASRALTSGGQSADSTVPPTASVSKAGRASCCCSCNFEWERVTTDVRVFTHSRFLTPRALLGMRLLFALWQLPAAVSLGYFDWGPNSEGITVIVTLSYLSYITLVLYFWSVSIFTLLHPKLYRPVAVGFVDDSDVAGTSAQEVQVDWRLKALWVVFQVLSADAFVVTSVYWTVLHKGHGLTWQDAHMHTLNAVMMLCEIVFNALPVVGTHIVFLILLGVTYLTWGICVHAVKGAWIYPFLNYESHWWSPLQYPAVLLYACMMFGVVYGVYRTRERYAWRTGKPSGTVLGGGQIGVSRFDLLSTPLQRMSIESNGQRLTDETGLTDSGALRIINSSVLSTSLIHNHDNRL